MRWTMVALACALSACGGARDADRDGAAADLDCDDSDPSLNLDDADGDGVTTCDGDCDDTDADVYPSAEEDLFSGDRDCDGSASTNLAAADYVFLGEAELDGGGWAVASAGDVDGDGLDDLLIGADQNQRNGLDSGTVYLFLAKNLGADRLLDLSAADYLFLGATESALVGSYLAPAGDVDGDGLGDFLIGGQDAAYLVLGASLDPSASTLSLDTADYRFRLDPVGDVGPVSSAGDVDGDGLDDVLIGALGAADGAGATYLFLGSSLGLRGDIDLGTADYVFVGEQAGDGTGASLARAGDIDGDGLDDVLIGAESTSETAAGVAYLVLGESLGSETTIDLGEADYRFIGEDSGDQAGQSVAGPGDVDGDGLDDILIGAPFAASEAGAIYMLLGEDLLGALGEISLTAASVRLDGETAGDRAGVSLSGADIDGDGMSDLLIGSFRAGSERAGRAYLVLGSGLGSTSSISLTEADVALDGEQEGDWAGYDVATLGDANGDGRTDLLISAPNNDETADGAGKSYLLLNSL